MEKSSKDFTMFGSHIATSSSQPLRGKPFQADYEEVQTRISSQEVARRWGSLARNSEGQWREDIFIPDPEDLSSPRQATVIWDPISMNYNFIDHKTNQLQKIELSPIMQQRKALEKGNLELVPPEHLPSSTPAPVRSESLGEKVIGGMACQGTLYTLPSSGGLIERWFSVRLASPVLEITKEKKLEVTYRLINIRLTEPDPSLFIVPKGAL